MSSNDKIKILQHYRIFKDKVLGKGTFGYVYLGEDTKNKFTVAIKMIPLKEFKSKPEKIIPSLKNEIKNMQMLNHKNTVQLYNVIKTENNLYIIVEYCNQGNLDKLIKQKNLTEEKCLNIMCQIIEGFKCLNQNNIVHRDLKPENILIHDKTIKIADFGFSKVVEAGMNEPIISSFVGTPLYMSPQILQKQNYSSKTDIWSLGMIFYELIYSKRVWEGKSYYDLLENILKKPLQFPPQPRVHPQTKQIISKMLQLKEEDRIGWEELFQFFSMENLKSIYSDFMSSQQKEQMQQLQNLQLHQLYDSNQPSKSNHPSSPTSTFSMKSEKIDEEDKFGNGFSDKITSDTNLNRMDEESNGNSQGMQNQKSQDSQDNEEINDSQMNKLIEYLTQNININQQFQLICQLQFILNKTRDQNKKLTFADVKQLVMGHVKPVNGVSPTAAQGGIPTQNNGVPAQNNGMNQRGGLFANSNFNQQNLFNQPSLLRKQDSSQMMRDSSEKSTLSENNNGNHMNGNGTNSDQNNKNFNINDID